VGLPVTLRIVVVRSITALISLVSIGTVLSVTTNSSIVALRTQRVAAFHEGRGSPEGVFAELKSHCHLDSVPVRTLDGNQTYLLAGLFASNLTKELQMQTAPGTRGTTAKRPCLWVFEKVGTLRQTLLHILNQIPANV
jgi:hypothetical protein